MKLGYALLVFFTLTCVRGAESAYDPLHIGHPSAIQTVDRILVDPVRKREVPIRVYLPNSNEPAPVVLLSHGLGGSSKNNPYLGNHWASRGYFVVCIQHPGSDESVWKEVPWIKRKAALKAAANLDNTILRFDDVSFVLDQLTVANATERDGFYKRMDLDKVGMSGHSYGAVTTQGVSGQRFLGKAAYTDGRIDAALAMSPSSPRGGSAQAAFGTVAIPWLLMTGTEDLSPLRDMDVSSRLAVYEALPEGSKYELLLDGAKHSAFGDHRRGIREGARNPNHHRAILAISTAFWDAYLRDDASAKQWLQSEAPTVLEAKDRWQWK